MSPSQDDVNQLREYEVFRQRFFSRLKPEGECLVWTGARYHDNYGQVGFRMNLYRAHRVAWVMAYGTIPQGKFVCHRCDNPPCCKPEHLYLGTNTDNMRDAKVKDRMVVGFKNPNRVRGSTHGMSKLTEDKVRRIRHLASSGMHGNDLGPMFGVTRTTIGDVLSRRTWGHVE